MSQKDKSIVLTVIPALLFLCAYPENACFAQSQAISQIQKAEEDLEKERFLRERLEQEEKAYIQKIIVKGTSLLSEEEIRSIISPYQKKWLTRTELQQILEVIKESYKEKGLINRLNNITYRIHKKNLLIEAQEVKN